MHKNVFWRVLHNGCACERIGMLECKQFFTLQNPVLKNLIYPSIETGLINFFSLKSDRSKKNQRVVSGNNLC